jgi:hypothetical protein
MYAHVENGSVTYRGTLPKKWRNISGLNLSDGDDDYLKTLGWLPYVEVSVEIGADETSDGEDTVITETKVTATAKKRAMTDAEKTDRTASNLQSIRIERNLKLADTDFYALSDVTMSSAMTTYRQALRDITDDVAKWGTSDWAWPTEPA